MTSLGAARPEQPRMPLAARLLRLNWPFLLLITAIASIGACLLYSAGGGTPDPWASRHVLHYVLGLGLLFAIALTDISWWLRLAYPLYLLALVALAAVLVLGNESSGAVRWLGYGAYSFQPSELMKIALVLALARYYHALPPQRVSHPSAVLAPLLMIAAPILLALAEPDLGTAALFAIVGFGLLLLAGLNLLYFLAATVGIVALLPHLFERLHAYQRERVLTFLDPERDPQGAGYHILQSKIAIGSGGVWGKGFMHGTQGQLNFLPEKHTDFIFTILSEEMGFIGAVALLTLYLLALLLILWMALRCRSSFARLAAAGMGLCLFAYVFINVAMVTGLVPVVGVPLPLVSYGGTSMLTMMAGFGFVLNASLNRARIPRQDAGGRFWVRRESAARY